MDQRISSGGIVFKDEKILLVHHKQEGSFDFWVMPGGGIEGKEGIKSAAQREVFEETGLYVKPKNIAYIEDFVDDNKYICKFWVFCELIDGDIHLKNKESDEIFLVDAGFFSKDDIQKMNVFPEIVKSEIWKDSESGFSSIKYFGYRPNA